MGVISEWGLSATEAELRCLLLQQANTGPRAWPKEGSLLEPNGHREDREEDRSTGRVAGNPGPRIFGSALKSAQLAAPIQNPPESKAELYLGFEESLNSKLNVAPEIHIKNWL